MVGGEQLEDWLLVTGTYGASGIVRVAQAVQLHRW
jgi:hypothetical protein